MDNMAGRTIILIPTYNEVENIKLIIERVVATNPQFYILVIDDDSPDGTAAEAKKLMGIYPRLQILKRVRDHGFAQSYIEGFYKVKANKQYDVVVMMDADFSHDPQEIPRMLEILGSEADVVTGSRYAAKQNFPGISPWRRALSRFANSYVRLVLSLPTTDCTSGFVMMRRSVLERLPLSNVRTEGYGFLFQLKYLVVHLGYKLVEHPVAWPNRHQGNSKLNLHRIFESAILPWKIKFLLRKEGSRSTVESNHFEIR